MATATYNRAPTIPCPCCGSKACMALGGEICPHTNRRRFPDEAAERAHEREATLEEGREQGRAEVRAEVAQDDEPEGSGPSSGDPGWPSGWAPAEASEQTGESQEKGLDGPPRTTAMRRAPRQKSE